jgi:glycosyltransferase involved in cell wall biosynthesis
MFSAERRVGPAVYDSWAAHGLRIGYVSTYPPRECGIATFCEDLLRSACGHPAAGEPLVAAVTRPDEPHDYQAPVRHVFQEGSEEEAREAAAFLDRAPIDVVSLQHEFGIYGGPDSRSLQILLDHLSKPVIATLHTVVPDPSPAQRRGIQGIAARSERVIVMNELARGILAREYGVDPRKVAFVHHGAPPPGPETREKAKAALGLSGRKIMLTFGLVGPGKGLEYGLRALPEIRRSHPEVLYLIVGKTHPGVQRLGKESYRDRLLELTRELRVESAVQFVDAYQTKADIIRYLTAADIYITPYLNPAQICSGTLAYAMAAGRAIISTPYLYAQFLLAHGRGCLVPFRDSAAIARVASNILGDRSLQWELEARARQYGRDMYWPVVGRRFVDLCAEILEVPVYVAEPIFADRPYLARYADVKGGAWHAAERRQADVADAFAATD